jgi:DNA-binding GntR family transcriptional regulator
MPSNASREVAQRLGLKPADAYLLLKETHFSESSKVLGFSLIHVNDHFVRFHLYRGGDGL